MARIFGTTTVLLVGFAATLFARDTRHVALPASACGAGASKYADELLSSTALLASDSSSGVLRDTLGLSQMAASAVQAVTTDSICAVAAVAINRDLGQPDSLSRTLYLVRAGTHRYFALDTTAKAGEWMTTFVFDSTFTQLIARLDS